MSIPEQLAEQRIKIDKIDSQLIPLFVHRMEASEQIAKLKQSGNLSVNDPAREQQVIDNAVALAGNGLAGEAALLMRSLMALSRGHQRKLLYNADTPLLPPARSPATGDITCVYQGIPGSWSEQAADKLFPDAALHAVRRFEDVFLAVKNGSAAYGVVAIENSRTGAIGETYDLLRTYGCYIVGRTWIDIRHCLLAPQEMTLGDVREVLSHPEGLRQCSRFLDSKAWDQTACRNTAVAAQKAAEAHDGRTAAIGSRRAAELHGLKVLAEDIMDSVDNRTSFVVIAAQPEYNEASDLISLTFSTRHRSGALCEALLPYMAAGLNLMRIESRPAGADRYRFFAEIAGNIGDPAIANALRQSGASCEYFELLGCYSNT